MFFGNPLVWWLAPLIGLPLLIHFRRFFKQRIQSLPSLFFVQKLARRQGRQLTRHYLIEIILEMLLIALILLIWSQPTWQAIPQTGERLILLIDDSPSMRYFYIENKSGDSSPQRSALLASVDEMLQAGTFSQIEARRLSLLGRDEGQTIKTIGELEKFLSQTGDLSATTTWQAHDIKTILPTLISSDDNKRTQVLLYSDFKQNHFATAPGSSSNDTADTSPLGEGATLYVLAEESAPYLSPPRLTSRHLFEREKITLTHKVNALPPQQVDSEDGTPGLIADELFVEVSVDDQKVFLSRIEKPNAPAPTPASTEDSTPDTVNSSLSATYSIKSDLVFADEGIHVLSIALKNGETVIQRHSEVVFVTPKLSMRLIAKDPRVAQYLEALFLYDKRAETITLSSTGNILFITDPATALATLSEATLRQSKAIVLLSPGADVQQMELILRRLSGANIYLSSLEKVNAQSTFYWNERPNETPRFDTGFSLENTYLKLSPSSLDNVRTLFALDNHPILFTLPGKVFLTVLSEQSLLERPHPLHLVWFYEALFALNGGREVLPVYDETAFSLSQAYTQARPLESTIDSLRGNIGGAPAQNTTLRGGNGARNDATREGTFQSSEEIPFQTPRIWVDDEHVYILQTTPNEYRATSVLPKGSDDTILPHLGPATVLQTLTDSPTRSADANTLLQASPVSIALALCLLCALALLSSLARRLLFQKNQRNE